MNHVTIIGSSPALGQWGQLHFSVAYARTNPHWLGPDMQFTIDTRDAWSLSLLTTVELYYAAQAITAPRAAVERTRFGAMPVVHHGPGVDSAEAIRGNLDPTPDRPF